MSHEAKNVDDVLTQVMSNQLPGTAEPPPVVEQVVEEAPQDEPSIDASVQSEEQVESPVEASVAQTEAAQDDKHIDEYGNPLKKPRMYSEEEVQSMIRDRLSRGRHAEQPPQMQAQVQKEADGFQADPNSEESWEVQLEKFIDRTIEKRQAKISEHQWRQQEAAKQAEFESKFTTGMQKYTDFHQVVAGKPITDSMMMATRNLENPAAFVYGASKMHPQELERIAKIADPYVQAAEVGRLHERMVKERRLASNAPKPLETPKSDMPAKSYTDLSLEQRIHQHAKQRFTRR